LREHPRSGRAVFPEMGREQAPFDRAVSRRQHNVLLRQNPIDGLQSSVTMVRSSRSISQPAASSNVLTISRRPYQETVGPSRWRGRGAGCSRVCIDDAIVMAGAPVPPILSNVGPFRCRDRSICRHHAPSHARIAFGWMVELDSDQPAIGAPRVVHLTARRYRGLSLNSVSFSFCFQLQSQNMRPQGSEGLFGGVTEERIAMIGQGRANLLPILRQ
jgi:hypothetical protein